MKIRHRIGFVCALGILVILGTGVFTGSPGEEGTRGRRFRPVGKFLRDGGRKEWPFSMGSQPLGHSATTLFKVLISSAPDMFDVSKKEAETRSVTWMDAQVKAITAEVVLDRVVKELNLAEDWGVTSAGATAKLRSITKVSHQEETDVFAVTVRYSDSSKAAEMANAVREAYVACRESVETERVRRLVANVEAQIASLQAKVDSAGPPMTPEEGTTPENVYARGHQTYESQLLLLNTMREHKMRITVDQGAVRRVVEVLEIAKPGSAN
jgi:hypothetical protein